MYRRTHCVSGVPSHRQLRFEPLEERRLLAVVTVNNNNDSINGTITSVGALIGTPGPDGISLREAIAATNAQSGADQIVFDVGLDGAVIHIGSSFVVTDSLTIDASALANGLTTDGGGSVRVFQINDSSFFTVRSVTLRGLTITGGNTTGDGGAIFARENLTLDSVTVTGNRSGSDGGGIYLHSGQGATAFTIINSTVSNNAADRDGGGIYADLAGVTLTILHSTITQNVADDDLSGTGNAGNGGGIDRSGGTVQLKNTIVAGNVDRGGQNPDVSTVTAEYSLIGTNAGSGLTEAPLGTPDVNGNFIGGPINGVINAMLGPLADNGGPTFTHALLAGSPAINKGNPSIVSPPANDQRGAGFSRVSGGRIDIGAFEVQVVNSRPTNPANVGLTAINEDTAAASISGTLVSAIVTASGSTDPNGDTLGIAITAVNNANGQWEYSTNGGSSWLSLSGVSTTAARLLAPAHKVRFVPNANYNSLIAASPTASFTVWDQTSGTAGSIGDTTSGTSFSTLGADATQPVTAVNDAPSFALSTTPVTSNQPGPVAVSDFATNIAAGPVGATDEASQLLTFLVSVTGTTGNLAFSAVPSINSSGTLTFTAHANTTGTATVQVVLQDNGSGTSPNVNTSAAQTFSIQVVAPPPNLVVDTLVDDINNDYSAGDLSLREAIGLANGAAGTNTIQFAVALNGGTIYLSPSYGQIAITEALAIDASNLANGLTINANNNSRIFNITATSGDFALSKLTLTGGRTILDNNPGDNTYNGGAIRLLSTGTLTLTQCTITDNRTEGDDAGGGGIYASAGDVTLIQSTVSGNRTKGIVAFGGGVYVWGDATIIDSTVSGNITEGDGSFGGGLFADGNSTITRSTISGNSTTGNGSAYGGGIMTGGNVTLSQSTVSDNSTAGTDADGGGIFAVGDVSASHSTVAGNHALAATARGGGIHSFNNDIIILGSIVAGNTAGEANPDLSGGATYTVNYSLIGSTSGTPIDGTTGAGNLLNANPLLGPLANNGGPTMTRALLAGSPAINVGDPAVSTGFDQRGAPYARVVGGRMDMGAFEVQTSVTVPELLGDYNLNHEVDASDFVLWRNSLGTTNVPQYSGADGDGDTTIDADDFGVWRSHFGNVPPPGAGGEVEQGGLLESNSLVPELFAAGVRVHSWKLDLSAGEQAAAGLESRALSYADRDRAIMAWLAQCGSTSGNAMSDESGVLAQVQVADGPVDDAFDKLGVDF